MGKLHMNTVLIIFVVIMLSGCTQNWGTYSAISTRQINWDKINEYELKNLTENDDEYLAIELGIDPGNMADVIDRALLNIPNSVSFVDVDIKARKRLSTPFVLRFDKVTLYIRGKVLTDPNLSGTHPPRITSRYSNINQDYDYRAEKNHIYYGTFSLLSTKQFDWARLNEYERKDLNKNYLTSLIVFFVPLVARSGDPVKTIERLEKSEPNLVFLNNVSLIGERNSVPPIFTSSFILYEGNIFIDGKP
ncbi:MAG: hypothetical protein FWG98_05855 [Candidatus Cloacimonetes bacterium]|nr:hypothetical protein [Candidatus Cloacimonadota bacterium]